MKKNLILLLTFSSHILAQSNLHMTLTLNDAEQMALVKNPHYQIQINKISAKKGAYWSEIMPENPEIGVELEEIPKGQAYTQYNEKRLFVKQDIDFPTNYFFQHKILKAEIEQEIAQAEKVKREILFQVKHAYYNLLMQRKLLALSKQNMNLSEEFYKKSITSYELGETDRLTMLKAKVNLGAAEKAVTKAQKDAEIGVSGLKEVLGIREKGNMQIMLTDSLSETVSIIQYESLRHALHQHPALLASENAKRAALHAKQLAYAKLLPELSISYFKQEIDRKDYRGGEIGLSVPLWFFRQKGLIQQKKAELSIAEHVHFAEQLRLQKEFNQALSQLDKVASEVELFQAHLLAEAEEVFRIASQSYNLGEISYLEFIDAQQTLIQTKESYIESLFQYQIEKANLTRLTGVEF